ncbi:MAG: 16S rRNA (adenine(1518)-N(6)/adenine(1519)-N(6))-dimethyltransferase RsmA [Candidatus Binatia bacterium]
MIPLRRETARQLRDLGVRPRRGLGQNFLVAPGFVARIVAAAAPRARRVLEIGPGLGALSEALAVEAAELVLVEIDPALAEALERRFAGARNVRVIVGDALEMDFAACFSGGERAVVVANLPYSVGSQILLRLLDERRRFSRLVLMLQREVAARLTASPGTEAYGIPSVWVSLYGRARTLFRVPPGAFLPRPKVESAVVSIELRDAPAVALDDPELFRRIVRAGFGQRRKTLRRALGDLVSAADFARAGIDPRRRGETLGLEEFARLANEAAGARA